MLLATVLNLGSLKNGLAGTWSPRWQTAPSKHWHLGFSPARSESGARHVRSAMGILGHARASRACLGAAAQQLAPVQAAGLQLGNPEPPMLCH